MALSEQERQLLAALERDFYASEADVVNASGTKTLNKRAIVGGVLLVLAGFGAIFVGVVTQLAFIGALGFVLLIAGLALAFKPGSSQNVAPDLTVGSASGGRRANRIAGLQERLNERWQQRQDGER